MRNIKQESCEKPIFIVFGLNRPEIESYIILSAADYMNPLVYWQVI